MKLIYRLRYHSHVTKYNHLKQLIDTCQDERAKVRLADGIHYHEKSVLRYIIKS